MAGFLNVQRTTGSAFVLFQTFGVSFIVSDNFESYVLFWTRPCYDQKVRSMHSEGVRISYTGFSLSIFHSTFIDGRIRPFREYP